MAGHEQAIRFSRQQDMTGIVDLDMPALRTRRPVLRMPAATPAVLRDVHVPEVGFVRRAPRTGVDIIAGTDTEPASNPIPSRGLNRDHAR